MLDNINESINNTTNDGIYSINQCEQAIQIIIIFLRNQINSLEPIDRDNFDHELKYILCDIFDEESEHEVLEIIF